MTKVRHRDKYETDEDIRRIKELMDTLGWNEGEARFAHLIESGVIKGDVIDITDPRQAALFEEECEVLDDDDA